MKDYALNRGGLTDAAATEMKLKAAEDSAKRLTRGKKACREKSAEVIVCLETSLHEVKKKMQEVSHEAEGLNPAEVYTHKRLSYEGKNAENVNGE